MKKWSKLVLATMLSVGTLLVSGCIENLEPEGIADLRGAKAELLRAQTALQAAQAAKVEAEAALVLAQAKVQEAIAKQEEAKVAFIEAQTLAEQYKAEYQKLVNEAYAQEQEDAHQKRMYELEKLIAEQEAAMATAAEAAAKAAEEFKIYMLDVTRRLAEAQLQYDKAMDDIEISRNTLTEKQQEYLWDRLIAVEELKSYVAALTEELEDATDELAEATAELDEPTAQRVAIKKAERAVVKFQAKYEAALEAEEEALALLELDPMVTDWDAKREEIEDQKKALQKERDAKFVEAADRAKVWRDSIDLLDEAAQKYSAATGYDFDSETGLFSKVPNSYQGSMESIDVPEVFIPAPKNDEGYPIFGFQDFKMVGGTYVYGDEEDVVDQFENRILALSTYNTDAYQERIDNLNDLIEAAQADWNNYKIPMTRYEDAVAAYKAGEYLPYFNKYVFTQSNGYAADFSLEELVADYNKSLVDLDAAIEEYESVIEKYDIDLTEDYAALLAILNEEQAAADLAKVKAYQDASDKFNAAELIYERAQTAYLNAQADYNRKITIYTQDASYADMKSYIDNYDLYVNSGGDPATANDPNYDTATYNKYKNNVASYDAAQKAFNDLVDPTNEKDAQSVWDKAEEVYDKAEDEYDDSIIKANQAWSAAYDAANLKYNNACRELAVSAPELDYDYWYNLNNTVTNARTAVGTAMSALVSQLEYNYRDYESGENADIVVAEGTTYELSLRVWGVPSYLRKDVYDSGTNTVKYELIPADLKTIQDADYFLEVITNLADSFVYVDESYEVYAFEQVNWNFTWTYANLHYLGEYAGYPLVLPDYEVFVEDYEANIEPEKQRVWQDAYDILASSGYDAPGWVTTYSGSAGILANVYLMKMEIAEIEAQMKNIALVPDFIKAIEAAKAEFEAYAAEKAAEIDALKADVEANYPRLLEELDEVMAEAEAFDEKVAALDETLSTLEMLIGNYCEGYTELDDFVEYLEDAYEAALQTTWDVEKKLINAEKALADLKEGLVTAVEAAQKNFDLVTEELAEAQTLLDLAVEELQKAIELIYGDEELPEDPAPENPAPENPAPEDPAPEDPGAGDEGGETPAA